MKKVSNFDLESQISQFNLDYIIIIPQELDMVNPRAIFLEAVTSINQYIILMVKR